MLPFGLSTAPRVFSEVLAVVTTQLHKNKISVFPYLDDCLIASRTEDNALHAITVVKTLFENLTLKINTTDCTLTPTQALEF